MPNWCKSERWRSLGFWRLPCRGMLVRNLTPVASQMSEARMLAALREEVANMERRLEDERFAAASARQSFSAREQELEVLFWPCSMLSWLSGPIKSNSALF